MSENFEKIKTAPLFFGIDEAELPELLCSRRAGLDCMPEMCAATSDCAGRYRYTRAAQG